MEEIALKESALAAIWQILSEVNDPEIPVLSIIDLGIVKNVEAIDNSTLEITITPTYTGCPAMDMIAMQIKLALAGQGYKKVSIKTTLSPAWTTDWMTEGGQKKLKEYGISPPHKNHRIINSILFSAPPAIQCPHCNSWHTSIISQFGSTACKALCQCTDCREPFDYFKCH